MKEMRRTNAGAYDAIVSPALYGKLVEETRNCPFPFWRPMIAGRFRHIEWDHPCFEQATAHRRDPRFIVSTGVPQTRT